MNHLSDPLLPAHLEKRHVVPEGTEIVDGEANQGNMMVPLTCSTNPTSTIVRLHIVGQTNDAKDLDANMEKAQLENLSEIEEATPAAPHASDDTSEQQSINTSERLSIDAAKIPSVDTIEKPFINSAKSLSIDVTNRGPALEAASSPFSNTRPARHSPSYHCPSIALRCNSRHHWVPAVQTKYLNNLTLAVGFLELTNALDFPANVWNAIPIPTFAKALMGIGGGVSIIWSLFALRDMRLSHRNFLLLREERTYLKTTNCRLKSANSQASKTFISPRCHTALTEALLDLNFREVGWEICDRMLMDGLNGFAGVIVGTGTILAIGGANPQIYHASNLLSGYIGNSFNVVYGTINIVWSAYMLLRSRSYERAVDLPCMKPGMKQRMRAHFRRHERYALLQCVTVVVLSIGSMMSATMWQGYVVLLPSVFAAVVLNLLWRHGIGYDREIISGNVEWQKMDVERRLLEVIRLLEVVEEKGSDELVKDMDRKNVLDFMLENGMFEAFCGRLLHDLRPSGSVLGTQEGAKEATIDCGMIEQVDELTLLRSAKKCLSEHIGRRLRDQERWLTELWACLLSQRLGREDSLDEIELRSPVQKTV